LVRGCEKPGFRSVVRDGDAYVVTVTLKSGRLPRVTAAIVDRSDVPPLVQLTPHCGETMPGLAVWEWALRANASMTFGAVALETDPTPDSKAPIALVERFLASEATPRQIKAAIKALASYGDWIEQKLTGLDTF